MPPEPLPWDRSKKHDRSSDGGSIRSVARWRDSHHPPPRGGGWDDFRSRPPPQGGHGKQGAGYQLFSDDGCMSSFRGASSARYARRPSSFRSSNNNNNNNTGYLWDSSPHHHHHHDINAQRSVSDLLTYASHPQSDFENSSWDFKDQNDKNPPALPTAHTRYYDKHQHQSIGWKSLKWSRSTIRDGGGPHTTMPPDSNQTKPDLPPGRLSPTLQSPSADAPFEDACPRKKQRLGWGQGLAKYEKQKVDGSDDTLTKTGLLPCATIAKCIPSPRFTASSECPSPVTTSSVACSSSPGIDDKPHAKAANNDIDTCNLSGSAAPGFQGCLEEFSANLEHLSSATKLSSLLSDLLQLEDVSSGDSNFVKSTAMNKLLLVKGELSKALEKTECEIDLFENELKLLNSECESDGPRSVASDTLQVELTVRTFENVGTFSKAFQKPVPLQLASSTDMHVDMPNLCNEVLEGVHGEVKDDDIDSPGTATSKLVEPSGMEKAVSAYSMGKHVGCSTDVGARPASSEHPWYSFSAYDEKSASLSGGEGGNQPIESSISAHTLSDLNPRCDLNDLILVSNRNSARKAFEVFSKLLPADQSEIDTWGTCSVSCQKNNLLVKQKLESRKCFKRFKERALTLKFRALQHLWKEDMRLLSIRKYKAKSQKRIESNSRTPNIVYQKHRSSIRSRFTSPGSLTLVPTSEIVDFTNKLLSDSQIMICRDSLKMPALVDEKEKRMLRFVSSNGLIEDPCAAEKERVMINPWTSKEKEVFLEKLATFGKDFKKIASYLDHKTTADCVEFYYKNQKFESFEKIKKSELKKQERGFPTNTYLMTSGKKWNREVDAASLDLLGEASVIAAHADNSLKSQRTYASRSFLGGHYYHKTCWGDDASFEKSSSVDILGNEREATAADTLAGICGAISSEAMSSCVTSSVDPGESCQDGKVQKNSVMDQPLTPKFMQSIDDEETCSDESCGEIDSVDWTDVEKSNFIGALRSYGKDFVKIARCVRSRSRDQCKVFFSKARKSLGLDAIHLGTGREGTPLSDVNGGESDTEDAFVLEMESAICSTQSCSKLEIDYTLSISCEASDQAATNQAQSDEIDGSGDKYDMEQLNHPQTDEPERSGENDGTDLLNLDDGVAVGEGLILEKCKADHMSEMGLCVEDSSVQGVEEKLDGSPKIMQPDNVSKTDALIFDLPVTLHADVGCTRSTEGVNQQQIIIPVKESVSVEGQAGVVPTMSSDGVENKALVASAESLKTESRPEQIMVPEVVDDCNRNMKTGVDSNIRSRSGCFDVDSNIYRNFSHQAAEKSFRQSFSLAQNHHPQIPLELIHSVQKAQIISWKQKENTPVTATSVLPGSSLHYEDHLRQGPSSSTLNFEGTRNEQHQKTGSADVYQRYLLCQHSLNPVDSSQILRGYPLQVLSKKDVNGHVDCMSNEKQCIIHHSTVTGNFHPAQFSVQDFHREKCNGLKLPHSLAELPLLCQNHEQSSICHTRSHSQGSSDADDSCRNGDVKLFGQILSHPSTSHKPNLVMQESLPKSSSRTLDLKFTEQGADRALMISKLDANRYSGLEEFPARSYGFWDGSRIQTGYSSLPDSSILLAKYPAGFSDYSASSSCGEQQSLPGVIKRNDRNTSSVSIYPDMDASSNVSLPDYQVYRGYNGAKVQPFTVDVKRHDALSDLPKRNGLEMSTFQNQSKGIVGMNVMGTGILVGGCTGVSDPVAAIKMHYATTERYAGHSASIMDNDSWRGDMGR